MLSFPNAKINIGLRVLEKRPDGFHNIETIFCPLSFHDILEFVPDTSEQEDSIQLTITGTVISGSSEDNLIVRAYHLLKKDFRIPPLKTHLHKIIPVGAGLGGGSSDAAFMLKSLNSYFRLGITEGRLCDYASELGSDCAFFILNRPILGYERGNIFREIKFTQGQLEILIVNPGIHISTVEAYAGVAPEDSDKPLDELIDLPPEEWRETIRNDFESSVFQKYPLIADIKNQLYALGAVYASMSGSGSSVYGLFHQAPDVEGLFRDCFYWKGSLLHEQYFQDE